jgi:hypothetical protein
MTTTFDDLFMPNFVQGHFQPNNPRKYRGNPKEIIYRSSWELKFMTTLDAHPDVLEWGSEEIVIQYRNPIDNSMHRYFVDFYVKQRNKHGVIETILVEIKPAKQVKKPAVKKKPTKRYIQEVATWGINQAKWEAAEAYCKRKGWQFRVMTESELGIK